jgi:pimeloyl-ACP methyl ester carboxylesterase
MIVNLGGIELRYQQLTPNRISNVNVVFVFLHEALGSIGQWKSFPEDLCDQLGLCGLVYERQGHGKSSPFNTERDAFYLHSYAFEELPKFLDAVIDKSQQIIFIGHSDGGTIALLYASKYPQNVLGIVTLAAHVLNEPETIAGIQPTIDAYISGKLNGLRNYHGTKTDALFFAWANIWRDERFKNWNIVSEIGADLPALFIQGEDDQFGTSKQLNCILERFENGIPMLIEGCGHHPHLTHESTVISAISDWYVAQID